MDDPITIFQRTTSKRLLHHEVVSGALSNRPLQRHPLGFFVVMGPSDPWATLRMHYWPPAFKVPQAGFEIHDHQYDIQSHVFFGVLEQTVFELTCAGTPTHSVYVVDYDRVKSGLSKTHQKVSVLPSKPDIFSAGTSYRLPAGTFHLAGTGNESATVTLVLARHTPTKARVLGPVDGPDRVVFDRGAVSNSEAIELRRDIVDILEGS